MIVLFDVEKQEIKKVHQQEILELRQEKDR
jgi:hypothetical protein